MRRPHPAEGHLFPWLRQTGFSGCFTLTSSIAHPQLCLGNWAPGWRSELNQSPGSPTLACSGQSPALPGAKTARGCTAIRPHGHPWMPLMWAPPAARLLLWAPPQLSQPRCSSGRPASRRAGHFLCVLQKLLTRNIWKYRGLSWIPRGKAPAQPGWVAFTV